MTRTRLAAAAAVGALALTTLAPAGGTPTATAAPARLPALLTNTAHLDFLGDTVAPPQQARHTTWKLESKPEVGVLWTYADRNDDGSFRRVGGGDYDADTDTYGQGAFNADDVSRAAVVYLRHWQQTGSEASLDHAVQLLRGLTYLHTATGPNAGTVVLWMQPDGTLNPSAEPVELPDPSDSDASYWLARTIWALGEGYAAFRTEKPGFARFLRDRMALSVGAVDRQVLDAYGTYHRIDGKRTPAWLIADGADASAEAMLGLSSFLDAGGRAAGARTALRQLGEGVAAMSAGSVRQWPHGGVLPWTLSLSDWHAWSSQMPAGLASGGRTLGAPALTRTARRDATVFTPWLLTSGGPDNGRLPTRLDTTQIAYGVDSRVQSLLAVGGRAPKLLAGITAAWYFGANAAGEPAYDPQTGVTIDGIAGDGTVNRNSGAESTIHGLLSMLALDARPQVRALAQVAGPQPDAEVLPTRLQAEDGTLAGDADAVAPDSLWTGESLYGGTGYVDLGDGGTVGLDLPTHPDSLVEVVLDRRPGTSARLVAKADGRRLGRADAGGVGAQGDSPAPGALLPFTLPEVLGAGDDRLTLKTMADGDDRALLDAVVVQPLVAIHVTGNDSHGTALLRSAADRRTTRVVDLPGSGPVTVQQFDKDGRLLSSDTSTSTRVPVAPGGFTVARR